MINLKFKAKYRKVVESTTLSRKEKLEFILKDTVTHFNRENRCARTETGGCAYSPITINKTYADSEGCAVGRLFIRASAKIMDSLAGDGYIEAVVEEIIGQENDVVPIFLEDNLEFFTMLQSLHDSTFTFDVNGITSYGLMKKTEIENYINSL